MLTNANISSSLVRENVLTPNGPTDLVYRAPDLLRFLFAMGATSRATGGEPYSWPIITAANSSAATFSEGEAFAAPGKQTYGRPSISAFGVQVTGDTSGKVRDQVTNGGTYGDVRAIEIAKGTEDLYKKLDDLLCGSVQDVGIQSIIDSSDTYAGVAGSGVWAAYETSVGGALTVGVLQDAEETRSLTPYVGMTSHLLMPRNQLTNYISLVGTAATSGGIVRFNGTPAQTGVPYDVGMFPVGTTIANFNGLPTVPIRGLTTTVILGVDMSPDESGLRGVHLLIARDVTVEQLAKLNDGEQFAITMRAVLRVGRRNAHFKLTGVTA